MRKISKLDGPAAQLHNVTYNYGKVIALRGLSLEIQSGAVTSLLGPNGAGKTTAVKLMLGLLRPTLGQARLFGGDPTAAPQRSRIGAMLQIAGVPATLRVIELINLFRVYYPSPLSAGTVIELAGLQGLERRLFRDLSGGQHQRVFFALALCGDPEMLFLDEPTVGLDVEARRSFWQTIRNLVADGRTILLTTHYLEEADALSDRIVVLQEGAVRADGSPHEIKGAVATKKVRCLSRVQPAELLEYPGVHSARFDKATLEVLTSDAEAVVRRLFELDPQLRGLEVSGAGIEDAFLTLTSTAESSPASATSSQLQ